MAAEYRIPRQTDRMLLEAIQEIAAAMPGVWPIKLNPYDGAPNSISYPAQDGSAELVADILSLESQIITQFTLFTPTNQAAVTIDRKEQDTTDLVRLNPGHVLNAVGASEAGKLTVKLMALVRDRLRVSACEASWFDKENSEWSRYRDAQVAILNSLENANQSILVKSVNRIHEIETTAAQRLESKTVELTREFEQRRKQLEEQHSTRMKIIDDRQDDLDAREAAYNTMEARYVARQKQDKQVEQIESWLKGWSVTSGTAQKRWLVTGIYAAGIIGSSALGIILLAQTQQVLMNPDPTKVTNWQWLFLFVRSIVPFGLAATLVVYFLRWESLWARQHVQEEFLNRSRLLDLGRVGWLLEAVRDAHDNNQEIPEHLLKELSRNLFTTVTTGDSADIHATAFADTLLGGLSQLRFKSPDGTEVEATRKSDGK